MDSEKEIPFGAFDSELMHQEINIPEGFEATIEGNKIILKKIESDDEKIRKELIDIVAKSPITFAFEDKGKVLTWLEKQGEQKPPIQNGIIINGVEYELIKDDEADECDRCALKDLCSTTGEDLLCPPIFGYDITFFHRFEKRK